jgi:hypothetical protein
MILQASLSKNTDATGLFPELIAMSHSQYLSGVLSNNETGEMVLHAVARGTINPSAIRRLQNPPIDGVPRQKSSYRHILSHQRREKRRGYWPRFGSSSNLGTTREISPTISLVAGLPTTRHPICVWLPARFQTVSSLRMIEKLPSRRC